MKNNDVLKFVHQFYFDKESGKVDINNYGKYRLGLSRAEVVDYVHMRKLQSSRVKRLLNLKEIQKLIQKYQEIEGCNTCAVVDDVVLYYRHDVERFCDKMFNKTNTYWD